MLLSKEDFVAMFRGVVTLWEEHKDELSEIDSRFGDGDHGVTIGKIAALVRKNLDSWDNDNLEKWLTDLGDDIMAVGGGSAGPLYGTLVGGMAEPLSEQGAWEAGMLKAMFAGSLEAMQDISTAKIGDKTMMDALIPAAEAATKAEDDAEAILKAAAEAAEQGAKDSEQYVSKFGRAKSYKEQTIGSPDAGAVSTALFFRGLYEGYRTTR